MNNSEINDLLSSMKDLSKKELESIIKQPQEFSEEKIKAAKNLLQKQRDSLQYARTQIENEVALDEILAQLKQKGISEEKATKIIHDASINANLDKKKNEIAQAVAKEEGNTWTWISGIFTIIVIIRIIMRIAE